MCDGFDDCGDQSDEIGCRKLSDIIQSIMFVSHNCTVKSVSNGY